MNWTSVVNCSDVIEKKASKAARKVAQLEALRVIDRGNEIAF